MSSRASGVKLLVDVKEACQALGVGRTTLHRLVVAGEIAPVRIGRAVRFRSDDLVRYVESLGAGADGGR